MLTASYAKINLFLELIGKLPNNYHQVNTILCSIDLFDLLNYELIDSPEIILTCNIPSLTSTSNLIYRVASYVKERFNVSSGIKIHLEKHIPISAGLGGGSSNAANCILALNEMWQLNLSKPQMHKIASQFGSDVNFFLEGGTAKGENRGEVITKLPSIFLNNILLVNPGIEISSAEAYKLAYLPKKQEQRKFDPSNLIGSCFNRLESG
ncbi:MAG: 4-(cytidine 5'-diphospho)-2-C-methyl-D-erythritol kinase, partial [Candidatus Cloacimonas acidaminovorans]|nr:4-(cytidine 5'-diphospho)-2-C-methyl-D-erythritol kinase [Candidatus Cloacimonas acidaminovorans]